MGPKSENIISKSIEIEISHPISQFNSIKLLVVVKLEEKNKKEKNKEKAPG